jgi:hypothetical protein
VLVEAKELLAEAKKINEANGIGFEWAAVNLSGVEKLLG